MRRARPEAYNAGLTWLRANGHNLAPLTGTDTRVLLAVDAAWRAYGCLSYEGRRHVQAAVSFLLAEMQPKTRHLAIELIARHLDWADRDHMLETFAQSLAPSASELKGGAA